MSKSIDNIETVGVDYTGYGAFQGGEEDCYDAKVEEGESYLVIKKLDYDKLQGAAIKYSEILQLLTNDESGDIEFVRHQVSKIVENKQ